MAPAAPQHFTGWAFLLRRVWSLWMAAWFWGYFLALFPLYLFLLGLNKRWARRLCHYLNKGWACVILSAGLMPLRVKHLGLPPATHQPCIYVANHRSYLDTVVVHAALGRPFRFIGKAELSAVPFFGYMYQRLHIALDRNSARQGAKALLQAEEALRAGDNLFIYPEGTTRNGGVLLAAFRPGAFYLALRTSAPIVPVTLLYTDVALPADGRFLPRPQHVQAIIANPIYPASFAALCQDEAMDGLQAEVRNQLLANLVLAYGSDR